MNHLDLTVVNQKKVSEEINKAREIIRDVTGFDPNLVRPPYGAYDESIILWSVDSLDWQADDAQAMNQLILETITSSCRVFY